MGKRVARDEFLSLPEAGQAALHDLFTRYENGRERAGEVEPVKDTDLWEFRVQVGTNPFRAYFFKDGPKYVIVVVCTYKNQRKMSKTDKSTARRRMASWRAQGVD
ncbi:MULTISPECIES: type II toxin-antitoxin system RelE/ParE family toxin [Catenuloplanes]|uniref:Component of toxin-antitoxin plasmid stabilization module n=1 Tax=Catenuloplanes niger TaxID=587534 RepID=A0AAE4CS61_9ACTN|nr:type II toxin-antitoxin system RelE/ParE family toxin [Catenuloplanes niger]MDR7322675.1 putative component of toxin-antitoxin plasmid stabilization module [Catenuloplanes niger]